MLKRSKELTIGTDTGLRADDPAVLMNVPAACDLNREIQETDDRQRGLENDGVYLRTRSPFPN